MKDDLNSKFAAEREKRICSYQGSTLAESAARFMFESVNPKYSYNFSFLGRPIIQYPQDMVAVQELIWLVKPDLIIETGIAHGGSLILSASMLALLDYCDAVTADEHLKPTISKRKVLGVDIDIRPHNKIAIEQHPMAHKIDMIQGSSICEEVIKEVHEYAKGFQRIMVFLDSNHTHQHVSAELSAYTDLVSIDSYCIVFDTIIEDLPPGMYPDRNWDVGNNPKTAVKEFLHNNSDFQNDILIEQKLLITVAPGGFLKRIK